MLTVQLKAQNTFPPSGNVGIGLTNPAQELTIKSDRPNIVLSELDGTAGVIEFNEADNQLRFQHYVNEGVTWQKTLMSLDVDNSRVSIGTISPTTKFQVAGGDISTISSVGSILHLRTDGNGDSFISNKDNFVNNGSAGNRNLVLVGNNGLSFKTGSEGSSGTPRMVLHNNGNMGVGTTNPSSRVHLVLTDNGGGDFKFHNLGEEGFLRMSNGANWGLMMRSDINEPKLGAYKGGKLMIYPFKSSSGDLDIEKGVLTSFNFTNMRVGVGTSSPDSKLTVNGDIHAKEVKVDLSVPGPDYVFEEDYNLPSLESIQHYIKENKHLPEVPSAKEMEEKGIVLGEMNMLLLKKVEELTLHTIRQEEEIKKMKEEKASLQGGLEGRLEELMLYLSEQSGRIKYLENRLNNNE